MANDNRFGFKIDKGLSQTYEMNFIVASGTSASITTGSPTKLTTADGSIAGVVADMADGNGLVTAMRFAGICKRTSDETASAAGTVGTYAPVPGLVYRGKAKTASTADTQAEINALMGKRVVFDLTSSVWTVDAAATDALVNCVVIVGGIPASSELLFIYSSKGTIFNTATSM